jgi:hypothetical protein
MAVTDWLTAVKSQQSIVNTMAAANAEIGLSIGESGRRSEGVVAGALLPGSSNPARKNGRPGRVTGETECHIAATPADSRASLVKTLG